ncbi:PAF15 factor, partial [Anseranas semipalmata]|nr:PAF15 factor [Anseranas semipalmata]
MVRTKAGGGGGGAYRKVLAGRAPRKVLGSGSLNAAPSAPLPPGRRVGGNPVCVRPVPAWQRGIGEFLRPQQKENRDPGGEMAGSSELSRPGKK